jgi:hypothetical protein
MASFSKVYTALLIFIVGSTQKQLARQVTYFKAEEQILRRQFPVRNRLTQRAKYRIIRFAIKVRSLAFGVQG